MDRSPVASPCTRICTLDADDLCIGCGRTLDEIGAWSTMPDAVKRTTLATARRRLAESRVQPSRGISASSISVARL
ncbi:MAG: DUF1289 domain-containing protein [Sphingomonas bacterium]|nr:DUF1289 domain-containing protein [Sphingomonas bacterium]